MNNKKISIIVPVYNMEVYLNRCVDSILAQTYKNIEVILVDDGSKDSSPEICDQYASQDSRVKVIHKVNGGLSSARNAGLDVASGDYIGFVDSDDYISPEMYSLLATRLDECDADIANAKYVRVDEYGNTTPSKVTHTSDEDICAVQFVRELMLHTGDVSVCTKLFRAELFHSARFPEGKLNEDLLFMIDVFSNVNKVSFVDHIGYFYFTRSESISSGYGKAVIDMVGNSLCAMKMVANKYPMLKNEAMRFALYQHMAYLLLVPKKDAIKSNDVYVKALQFVRTNVMKAVPNKYLSIKNKLVIISLTIFPRIIAKMYQKKRDK